MLFHSLELGYRCRADDFLKYDEKIVVERGMNPEAGA